MATADPPDVPVPLIAKPLGEAASAALLRAIGTFGGDPWRLPDPLLDATFQELLGTRPEPMHTCLLAAEVAVHRYQCNRRASAPPAEVTAFLVDLEDSLRTHGATLRTAPLVVALRGRLFHLTRDDGRWQIHAVADEAMDPPAP